MSSKLVLWVLCIVVCAMPDLSKQQKVTKPFNREFIEIKSLQRRLIKDIRRTKKMLTIAGSQSTNGASGKPCLSTKAPEINADLMNHFAVHVSNLNAILRVPKLAIKSMKLSNKDLRQSVKFHRDLSLEILRLVEKVSVRFLRKQKMVAHSTFNVCHSTVRKTLIKVYQNLLKSAQRLLH